MEIGIYTFTDIGLSESVIGVVQRTPKIIEEVVPADCRLIRLRSRGAQRPNSRPAYGSRDPRDSRIAHPTDSGG